jgi:hypothetical protein
MPEYINIAPTGLYNAALRRQGIRLKAVERDGQVGLEPTEDGETVAEQVQDLVNRVVLLDQAVGFVIASNTARLAEAARDLRNAYQGGGLNLDDEWGEDDELDDLIAVIEGATKNINNIIREEGRVG